MVGEIIRYARGQQRGGALYRPVPKVAGEFIEVIEGKHRQRGYAYDRYPGEADLYIRLREPSTDELAYSEATFLAGFGYEPGDVSAPLVDLITGAQVAMGVRKLRSSYLGSCMRVRRSTDDAEADIPFAADDFLDEAALLAHVGAGDGFISTLYAQVGANNAVQATPAAQPRIVASGAVEKFNGRPTMRFLGGQILTISGESIYPGTVSCVHMPLTTNPAIRLLVKQDAGGGGQEWAMRWGNNTAAHWYRTGGGNILVAYSFQQTQMETWVGRASSNLRRNGSSLGSASAFPATPSTGTLKIGGDSAASANHTGRVSEFVIWPTIRTDAEVRTIERNQGWFYGMPVA